MKNTFLKTIVGTALAILMLTVFAQVRVSAQEEINNEDQSKEQTQEDLFWRRKNTRKLEGVWNVQVTRLNCDTGAVLGTGPAILTFVRGGIMHDFGTGRAPSTRSPGYGVWSYSSNRRYSDHFQFFIYNADGTLAGKQMVREQIVLSHDGNSFTNSAASQILDVNGNVTMNRCSTAIGTRFE